MSIGKAQRVAIIGSGVIGEAAGRGLLRHGRDVSFCDIREEKITELKKEGLTAIFPDELPDRVHDVFLVSIQTPTTPEGVDLTYIQKAYRAIGHALKIQKEYAVVATRSTVPVGTAETVVAPILEEASGKRAGVDFSVASNPEYLRELTAFEDFIQPRLIVIGTDDDRAGAVLEELYKPFGAPIHHVTTAEAEMQKYVHNLLNAAKISFFNEQRDICNKLGISADAIFPLVIESAEAIWNPRYGTKNLGAYGGACLPKDVKGFLHFAHTKLGIDMPLLRSVDEVNEAVKRKEAENGS